MSLKSKADLTLENASVITGATSPNFITPTTHGAVRQNVIDSMFNLINEELNGGETLNARILSLINANLTGSTMSQYLFRATKILDQPLGTSGTQTFKLQFEDDTTSPNHDESNLFYTERYCPNSSMVRQFALENVTIKTSGAGAADTYTLHIKKNGVTIVNSAAINGASVDAYGNIASGTGYVFPALSCAGVSCGVNDVITAELVQVYNNASLPMVLAGAIFSCG